MHLASKRGRAGPYTIIALKGNEGKIITMFDDDYDDDDVDVMLMMKFVVF